jgi:hypothetical protein
VKRILQLFGALVILAGLAVWLIKGANTGWTKTSVPVKTLDEITGIEEIAYKEAFMPGLDFLGGTVLAGGILIGASLFFRKKQN